MWYWVDWHMATNIAEETYTSPSALKIAAKQSDYTVSHARRPVLIFTAENLKSASGCIFHY
jgi:hypothetical protein